MTNFKRRTGKQFKTKLFRIVLALTCTDKKYKQIEKKKKQQPKKPTKNN